MKILHMLLHDFRFAKWSMKTFLDRYHFAKAYAKHLGARGHDVNLLVFHQDVKRPRIYVKHRYTLHVLPNNFVFPPLLKFGNEHSLYLMRYIKDLGKDIDIIHIHNYWLWNTPYVILLIKQFLKNTRIVMQYHGETDPSKIIRAVFFKKIYDYADLFLVARESEITFLKKHLLKECQSKKIVKFPNVGANNSIFKPVEKKSENPSIIYTGRITHERKNKFPFILLKLSRKAPLDEVTFYIVGDGPLLKLFKKYVSKHNLTNVHLTGYLPVSEVVRLMSKCWLYFYPGFLERADGYWDGAIKEALLCGTPTVALNINVDQRNIIEDVMGFLLPSKSFDTIVEGLRALLTKKEQLLQKSKEVLKRAQVFSWENIITRLEKIYRIIC